MATTANLVSSDKASIVGDTRKVPSHGLLRYITPGITPIASPHLYHLPAIEQFGDVRSLPITNTKDTLRLGDSNPFSLNTHGFVGKHHASRLHSAPYDRQSWNDETLLKSVYVPEVETMLRHLTGAAKVVTEMVLMRSRTHSEVDALAKSEDTEVGADDAVSDEIDPWPKMIGTSVGGGASPAPKVHLDFSPTGARTHLRKFHGELAEAGKDVIAAEDRLLAFGVSNEELIKHYHGRRWAMYSIWRPLKRVRRDPLAFADRRSFPKSDYIPVKLVEPIGRALRHLYVQETEHEVERLLAYGSEDHKWCWIWEMEPQDVVVIQLFDSEAEKKGYCGVMHSSTEVPGTENEPARESIEVCCTAIW